LKHIEGKQNWRKSYDYYRWREDAFDKYGHICNVCGSNSNLHVHHLRDATHNPTLKFCIKNAVIVCRQCHLMFHTLYKTSYRKKTTKADFKRFKAIAKYFYKKGFQDGMDKTVDIFDI